MENTRNFVIIAHIDHGKSTLADRFLELTKSVEKRKMQEQYLDQMELERERGITIKMQPVMMRYREYILNLIDTPGHVDFSYEVSRALAAVEGAVLLVDATKGIQAQTVAHLSTAAKQKLKIIPVINKIDLPQAQVKETEEEILHLLLEMDCDMGSMHKISAKTGEGIEDLLEDIVSEVPPPKTEREKPLKTLIFDSVFDDYQGIISHVRVLEGEARKGDNILFMASKETAEIKELGIFLPERSEKDLLSSGDIGYIASGIKDIELAGIGDTITSYRDPTLHSVPGYEQPQPKVFSTIFISEDGKYENLREGLKRLKLSDAALYFEPENSPILGRGFKVGFLGMLHMEIILERLRREYDLELVVTSPSVAYKVHMKNGKEEAVFNPSQYPDPSAIGYVEEPWINLEILVSPQFMNNTMSLLKSIRGVYGNTEYLSPERIKIKYETPLAEIISDFYDRLKNTTSGYGSMSYSISGYRPVEIVKLDILLAGDDIPALSRLIPANNADKEGRRLVERIKNVLPAEQFSVAIQAVIGGKIIARETRKAMRKDVTSGLYGGDVTRKRKVLEKQKKGKKRLGSTGAVRLDTKTLMKIFQ
ncbi:MAG: elongation factor 4 [Candidatus Spechtbacteria bacterium RIFCSPLOWO2_01_FULL_43_12]|uniref:Elongation factor 4 n=1 Tax=Candidatus Spechtbacteria bacterium RIFCSPLOWO2_01_FULL_43_12 TaxID=1802162 RepID=A0A1G2HDP3_9BACT|nr:MAG: elongation factor 4 [Candidatus Spechtbacteria bacterium RIFCSPLOWO2_01_FULL_43_12]